MVVKFYTDKVETFNIDVVDGESSNHVYNDRNLLIGVSSELNKDDIGEAYIDGIKLSKPVFFRHDRDYRLSISAGEIMKEYDKEYNVELKNFKEKDGTPIPDVSFKVKTEPKRVQDPKYKDDDEKALIVARESYVL